MENKQQGQMDTQTKVMFSHANVLVRQEREEGKELKCITGLVPKQFFFTWVANICMRFYTIT